MGVGLCNEIVWFLPLAGDLFDSLLGVLHSLSKVSRHELSEQRDMYLQIDCPRLMSSAKLAWS